MRRTKDSIFFPGHPGRNHMYQSWRVAMVLLFNLYTVISHVIFYLNCKCQNHQSCLIQQNLKERLISRLYGYAGDSIIISWDSKYLKSMTFNHVYICLSTLTVTELSIIVEKVTICKHAKIMYWTLHFTVKKRKIKQGKL